VLLLNTVAFFTLLVKLTRDLRSTAAEDLNVFSSPPVGTVFRSVCRSRWESNVESHECLQFDSQEYSIWKTTEVELPRWTLQLMISNDGLCKQTPVSCVHFFAVLSTTKTIKGSSSTTPISRLWKTYAAVHSGFECYKISKQKNVVSDLTALFYSLNVQMSS